MSIHKLQTEYKAPPNSGGEEPPNMEARVTALENANLETRDRLVRIEARLDTFSSTFATKEDLAKMSGDIRVELHKELHNMTWRLYAFAGVLVAAVYFIARNIH